MCQLLTVTWLISGRVGPQILQLVMTISFSVHTLTPPVPGFNTGDLGLNGMTESTGCLPTYLLCFFVKAQLSLAEHMASQQTE